MVDVLEFLRLLWAVDHALAAKSKQMEARLGVTGPQRFVLRFIGRNPSISAGALAEMLHLHPSTLTGVLRRLQARGFVERRPDPEDARRSMFVLTERGLELDGQRTGTVEAAVTRALAQVAPRKIDAARELLVALAAELAEDDTPPARAARKSPRHE